uniref:Uncharacterized protein n=1 Tax=Arundo donax TaxID=35708 RepID=A0A0A8Z1F7_ARUDO
MKHFKKTFHALMLNIKLLK